MSLPANHTSAFQCEECGPDCGLYFHIGPVALQRQVIGHGTIAFFDPQGTQTGQAIFQSPVLSFQDLTQPMRWGIGGTFGYFWNGQSIEGSGFLLFNNSKSKTLTATNGLDLPFVNPPAGFGGNNGFLFLQNNSVQYSFRSNLASAEINYRYSSQAVREAELIMGVRYIDQREQIGLSTNQDGQSVDQALYQIWTRNHMILPQIGFEYNHELGKYFTFGAVAKTGLGPNLAQIRTRLTRGDGLLGFDFQSTGVTYFSQSYDLGAFVDFNVLERCHLRFGYNALWLVGAALAVDQFNFDLSTTGNANSKNGTVFYHGPSMEFQFFF
jgi:hypothetical protein